MLCPICRVEMQLLSREASDKGVTEKYACRNNRCREYGKTVEQKKEK